MAKEQLTLARIRTARPPAGSAETTLYDGGGLAFRVRAGADPKAPPLRTWQYWYKRDGQRRRIGLGSFPDVSLADARRKADDFRELLRAGITPTPRRDPQEEAGGDKAAGPLIPRTVNDLAAAWEAAYLRPRHKDGGALVMGTFRRHIAPAIGKTRLLDVRKLHIVHVLDGLARDGKGRTAASVLGVLRQLFRWGIQREYLAADPTASLRKADFAGKVRSRERALSPDELRDLAARLRGTRRAGPKGRERDIPVLPLPHQAAVWVTLSTLARVGELSRARWEHIDFDAGTWMIPAEHAKNELAHLVHLSTFAVRHLRHLQQYAAGSAWVLPDRTGETYLDVKALTKSLRDRQQLDAAKPRRGRSTQRAALLLPGGPFTAHDLRRTGATMMQALGVEEAVIEKCLNHLQPNKLVRTYQRAELLPERREAFLRLGARLDELVPAAATAHLVIGGA